MECDLTKRRPSIIPGSLPGLPPGWSPSVGIVEESESADENEDNNSKFNKLTSIPSIKDYETKPYLTIKKFRSSNQTVMSLAHPHGICVLNTENEEIIACDHYNNRLLMFDSNTDGHLMGVFRGDMATPECVAPRPHYRQHIYITKPHSISLYDLEKKEFIRKLGGEENGHANNRFKSPAGIVADPDNGEVYMCDTWNNRICVFSSDFHYVNRRWYLTKWEQTNHKVKPNNIAINGNNKCVVTCDDAPYYRGAVYVFDKMGYIQKIYDHESRNKPPNVEARLNVPHGILFDDEENWLTVCYSDSETCYVHRRLNSNNDDDEKQEIITHWPNKELTGPSGLAIKRDKTLIVGDRDNNTISFFKLK